jgi:hypothetical protein
VAATINDYVSKVRQDLEDPNPPATIWSDLDLQRHVSHAVAEYQLWKPQEILLGNLSLTPGSRSIDLSGLATLMRIEAVEYPTGRWPPAYVQFQQFGVTLTLFLEGAPAASDPMAVNLYTLQRHNVTVSACTIDPADDEAIIAGAVYFAAAEYSFKTAGQINAAGPNTWLRYRDLALDKAVEFRGYLAIVRARITSQRAYAPAEPKQSRYAVEAPWRG